MPSTSRLSSVDPVPLRNRLGVCLCGLLLTACAVLGFWRALAAEPPRIHVVTIEAMKYTPAVIDVQVGDRVTFENKDLFPHTATAKPDQVFDSGVILPGKSWTTTVPRGGAITYACILHPTMEGKIVAGQK